MGGRCRPERQLPLIVDPEKGGLFLYPGNRDAKVILIGIQAERIGSQGSQPGGNLVIGDRPVFHFCRIAGIRAFRHEAQRAHAIAPDDGQQIKDAGAFGMLARRDFFPDGAIIGQQAIEVAGRTLPDQIRSDSGMDREMGNARSDDTNPDHSETKSHRPVRANTDRPCSTRHIHPARVPGVYVPRSVLRGVEPGCPARNDGQVQIERRQHPDDGVEPRGGRTVLDVRDQGLPDGGLLRDIDLPQVLGLRARRMAAPRSWLLRMTLPIDYLFIRLDVYILYIRYER